MTNAKKGVRICEGLDKSITQTDKYVDMRTASEKEEFKQLTNSEFSNNEVVKAWREAYQLFKTKKGARCSVEALLKRVSNGNHIGTINPLVDIYNSISLKYGMPCGGEDIDTFSGDIRLTKAIGNEGFITLGSEEEAPPYEGEIIYKDNEGAICRCWNWRESVRTMLTENTKNAFLIIEQIDDKRYNDTDENTGRNGFRFHLGTTSHGCVTVDKTQKHALETWDTVSLILNSTSTTTVKERRGKQWLNPFSKLIRYGEMKIKGLDKTKYK